MSFERMPVKRVDHTLAPEAAGVKDPKQGESAPTPSPYDFEQLNPALKDAVSTRVEKILEMTPIDKGYFSNVFNVEQGMIAPEELAYFQAYARLAVRQLIMGDFFGDEEPVTDESIILRELRERPLGNAGNAIREQEDVHLASSFDSGTDLLHDIAHTWVDLSESNNKIIASNMVPKFLKYKQSIKVKKEIAGASAHDESIVALYNTDGFRKRGGILKGIRKAKTREEFLDHDYLISNEYTTTEPPPFKQYVRGKIYDEYKNNPNLLFEIFAESTLPLMRVEATSEAEALERLYASDIPRTF